MHYNNVYLQASQICPWSNLQHVYNLLHVSFESIQFVLLDQHTTNLLMHTRVAGSGIYVQFGDIPSDVHTGVIFPVGTNPVSHPKSISVQPSVLGTATMEPLPGTTDVPQVTAMAM